MDGSSDFSNLFDWKEYSVFSSVLVASLAIGFYFGFYGNQNKTNEDFLMAGRSMGVFPVTLSLICSFISSVTLLGNPVEIYFYGSQYFFVAFSFIPMTLALAYLYVPVYFDLQLTSAYEYFEWRFNRKVRILLSIFSICHLMFYMPITVYGPSLALDKVAGIDYKISAASIFIVCIIYSSLGGLKGVLWTDALQAMIMFLSLAMVLGLGLKELGGWDVVWERAENSGRVDFWKMDPDPRTRHTFWTSIVGGFLLWMPLFGATQSQIQRYNSVPTLRKSRLTLLFNMIGLIFAIFFVSFLGMMIYAAYYNCDPVKSNRVDSADQLLPLFVMDVLGGYSGLPGLLVAGLTSGSLSTVSSALNSLTAILVEDYLKKFKPDLNETQLALASKIISLCSGCVAFALVFVIAVVNESINLSPFSTLLHGSFIGPILGVFTVGLFFPFCNNIGTFLGILASLCCSLFVGLGNIVAGREDKLPDQRLDLIVDNCTYSHDGANHKAIDWKKQEWSPAIQIWSISYIWLPGIGSLTTIFFCMVFSFIVLKIDRSKSPKVNQKLLSKPFLKLWNKIFGEKRMNEWVDYEEKFYGKQKKVNEINTLNTKL